MRGKTNADTREANFFYQDIHIDRLHLWLEVNFLFLLKINFFCQN
jgi:hypothetical protein